MEQIKILYILGAFSSSGGVESVVLNIYKNIDRSKVRIDFVLFNGLDHSRKKVLEEYGCKIYFIDRFRKGIIKFIYNTYKILRSGRYDVIHTHINEIGLFSAIAGMLACTPVRICHSHNTSFRNEKLVPYLRFLFKIFSTHLFACSKVAGIALFGANAKITVLNNAIDAKRYSFNAMVRANVRKSLDIENKFVIGNVGRLSYQKNHSFILEIYKRIVQNHKNTVLLLVGNGELEEEIKSKAAQLGIDNNIMFLGARDDVNELLQAMDVFLFPSHYEGLPVILIEAQSAGLPCLVSDAVTNEVQITDLVEFISLHKSTDYWVDAVLKYSKDYERKNTFNTIKNAGYEVRSSVKNIQELYETIVKDKGL